jgi:hypothetical protein
MDNKFKILTVPSFLTYLLSGALSYAYVHLNISFDLLPEIKLKITIKNDYLATYSKTINRVSLNVLYLIIILNRITNSDILEKFISLYFYIYNVLI